MTALPLRYPQTLNEETRLKDALPIDKVDATIARIEKELNAAREAIPDAALATARARATGEHSEAILLADSKVRALELEVRSLRYLRTHVAFDELDAEIARREHHYAAEAERCETLRARSADRSLREVSGGVGDAWREAERDRKSTLRSAFAAYEELHHWCLSERRELDELIEERDALSSALAAILPH